MNSLQTDLEKPKRSKYSEPILNYKMVVFNRWGEVIFMNLDRYKSWDGNYRKKPKPTGIYP